MKKTSYQNLSQEKKELLKAAEQAAKNAYCPYSHFSVGAAVLTKKGEIFTGANVENAAYGSSICAERSALLKANSEGKLKQIKTIAVICKTKKFQIKEPSFPCGACRQMISEFAFHSKKDIEIICSNPKKDKIFITSIKELYPFPFGPQNLK